MKKTICTLIVYLTGFLLGFTADQFGWSPAASISLGSGFDPQDLTHNRLSPIVNDDEVTVGGGPTVYFESGQIKNLSQFLNSLKIDVNASAQYGLFQGNAGLDAFNLSAIDSSSLTWYVQARIDYGLVKLKDPQLTERAQQELATNQDMFKNSFGTYFISSEDKSAMLTVVFTVNNFNSQQVNSLSSFINAGMNSLFAGGHFSGQYQSLVSDVLKNSAIQVSYYSRGGPSISIVSGIITNMSDLSAIQYNVSTFLSSANSTNAQPIAFSSTPLSVFGLQIVAPPTLYDRSLQEYFSAYITCESRLSAIEAFLNQDQESLCWVRSNVLDKLQEGKSDYLALESQILSESADIRDNKKPPHLPDISLPKDIIPKPRVQDFPTQSICTGYVENGAFDNIHLLYHDQDIGVNWPLLTWAQFTNTIQRDITSIKDPPVPPGASDAVRDGVTRFARISRGFLQACISNPALLFENRHEDPNQCLFYYVPNPPINWVDMQSYSLNVVDCNGNSIASTKFAVRIPPIIFVPVVWTNFTEFSYR